MLKELAAGTLGAGFTVSPSLQVRRDEPRHAELFDADERLTWMVFFFAGVHLDAGAFKDAACDDDNAAFVARVDAYARQMFDTVFAQLHVDDPPQPEKATPRTADPRGWSALVDVERVDVQGAHGVPALRTVHHMAYEPGRELVMGHLLVPLRDGLLEVRMLGGGKDPTTGVRESVLMIMQEKLVDVGKDPSVEFKFPSQSTYDDPAHDAQFPGHPLSQVRAALRSVITDLRVEAPPPPRDRGVVELSRMGCALRPPCGFVFAAVDDNRAVFERVAFCGTDGVESFVVERHGKLRGPFAADAAGRARGVHTAAGVNDVVIAREEVADIDGRAQLGIVVDGNGNGAVRTVYRYFVDGDVLWSVSIGGAGVAVAAAARAVELDAVARSWRPVAREKIGWIKRLFG